MSPQIASRLAVSVAAWLAFLALHTAALAAPHTTPAPAPAVMGRAGAFSSEDSVRAAETLRGDALLHADTTALSRLIADEFVEIARTGQLRSKADNLRDLSSGALKLTTVEYDSVSVRIYGNVAVLRGIADNTGSYRGMPFSGKIRYTRIFVRRDGRWQAIAMQHTPIL